MKNKLRKFIPALFYISLLIFGGLYISKLDWTKLLQIDISFNFLVVGLIIALVSRFWSATIWLIILKGLGSNSLAGKIKVLFYVYAKSWLGRYIPGTAPWILGKIYFASNQGISKQKLAVSSLLEGLLQIVVVMIIGLATIAYDTKSLDINIEIRVLLVICAAVGAITLIPGIFNYICGLTFKFLRRDKLNSDHHANGKTMLIGSALYGVGAIISGISIYFIAKSIYPALDSSLIIYIIGMNSLSGALGMIAFFAPSGIGVKEGVQLFMLSIIMPAELALATTVLIRLSGIIADLIFFTLTWMSNFSIENRKVIATNVKLDEINEKTNPMQVRNIS